LRRLKESSRARPKISLILLDWSVRESFHLLHYLAQQKAARDSFEVIVIEYYSKISEALLKFETEVDTWVLMEMPESCYYHKHLMYNAGILLSRGDICVICDSDAMVKEGFIGAIIEEFDKDPNIVLHLDQFRNIRRDFYPFNYPSFEDVLGAGCINNVNGKTRGVLDTEDPIHTRNYGACMCARRADLVAIGGADEHIDYLGHICGPYDMTFRLINSGRREIWHPSEFMYHTWHPGQAGHGNYLGPHDGRHLSTTALSVLTAGCVQPLVPNAAIEAIGSSLHRSDHQEALLVQEQYISEWTRENLENPAAIKQLRDSLPIIESYRGFLISRQRTRAVRVRPVIGSDSGDPVIDVSSTKAAKDWVNQYTPRHIRIAIQIAAFMLCFLRIASYGARILLRTTKPRHSLP
jgi:hypothetical protein